MDEALNLLKATVDDQEFIRLTKTVMRIIQNILNDPESTKFRTVRAACKVCEVASNLFTSMSSQLTMDHVFLVQYMQKAGVSQLLEAVGFKLKVGGSSSWINNQSRTLIAWVWHTWSCVYRHTLVPNFIYNTNKINV